MRKHAAIGLLYDINRRILLIKRRDVPVWVLPGGGIEAHETPEQAVCREVWEETGFRVKASRQIAHYTPINRLSKPAYVFECEIIDGALRKGCETQQIDFFDLKCLPRNFFSVHQDWLTDALKHPPGAKPLLKPIDNVTYPKLLWYCIKHPTHLFKFMRTIVK